MLGDIRYLIYKITNTINGKYYIGRHATCNVDDGYMGSGKAIVNALNKYGRDCFTKEIIAEAFSASDLWDLEKQIVNGDVVEDPLSYNMAYGGKSYLDGLQRYNYTAFIEHQSNAGKVGGKSNYAMKTEDQRREWHSSGGRSAALLNRVNGIHPFYNGQAASKGGKAVKGMVELWNPKSTATNKNQVDYTKGDSKKARAGSDKYLELISQGWLTIEEHKQSMVKTTIR